MDFSLSWRIDIAYTWALLVTLFHGLCTHGLAYSINVVSVTQNDLTCWTCPNKTDNEACNNWAPDVNCPLNYTWCMTVHKLDVRHGKSLTVLKKCALEESCTKDTIGCKPTDNPDIQECISCCNEAYCNEAVPFNHTAALLLSTFKTNSATTAYISPWNILLIVTLSLSILTYSLDFNSLDLETALSQCYTFVSWSTQRTAAYCLVSLGFIISVIHFVYLELHQCRIFDRCRLLKYGLHFTSSLRNGLVGYTEQRIMQR